MCLKLLGECEYEGTSSHLLVAHDAAGLQGTGWSTDQTSSRPVVLTEDCSVDVVKAIPGDQPVSAGCTGETLQRNPVTLAAEN